MSERTATLRAGRQNRGIQMVVPAVVFFFVLGAILYALLALKRSTHEEPICFDTKACVRVGDVSRVYRIEKDPRRPDSLWFATAEGLRVFDANSAQWIRYGLDHGLPSEIVTDVCFANDVPWVATWNGLARQNRLTGLFEVIGGKGTQFDSTCVLAVEFVPDGGVYFSVDGLGLFRIASDSSQPEPVTLPGVKSDARVSCLKQRGGKLLAGVEDQLLFSIDPRSKAVRQYGFKHNSGMRGALILDILEHKDTLYVATSSNGLWYGTDSQDSLVSHKDFPGRGAYVLADEPDGFWCGTPYGLWRYLDRGGAWIQFVHPAEKEPTSFQVVSLANTAEALWFGSLDLGAGYMEKVRVKWQRLRAGVSNPNVAALASNDTMLWISYGYRGDFLDRFDAGDVQYERNYNVYDSIMDPNIQTCVVAGGTVYYGGFNSFGYLRPGRGVKRFYSVGNGLPFGDISCIDVQEPSRLFLGSQFGLIIFSPGTDSFESVPATQTHRVTCLYAQSDSLLWYGTLSNGLVALDMKTKQAAVLGLEGTTGIVGVACAPGGAAGRLFAATKESGCYLFDPATAKAERLDMPQALLSGSWRDVDNNIMAARSIDSLVWLGTREHGCLVYDTRARCWFSFTRTEGLVTNQIRSLAESGRYVWVGGFGGFTRIDKEYVAAVLSRQRAALERTPS